MIKGLWEIVTLTKDIIIGILCIVNEEGLIRLLLKKREDMDISEELATDIIKSSACMSYLIIFFIWL